MSLVRCEECGSLKESDKPCDICEIAGGVAIPNIVSTVTDPTGRMKLITYSDGKKAFVRFAPPHWGGEWFPITQAHWEPVTDAEFRQFIRENGGIK